MEQQKIRLELVVTEYMEMTKDEFVRACIGDGGICGISKEIAERIFEQTLKTKTKTKRVGKTELELDDSEPLITGIISKYR